MKTVNIEIPIRLEDSDLWNTSSIPESYKASDRCPIKYWVPNLRKIVRNGSYDKIFDLIGELSPSDIRIFLWFLTAKEAKDSLNEYNLAFGQIVWYCIGDDYLNNWVQCRILKYVGKDDDNVDYILICSNNPKCNHSIMEIPINSIKNYEQFIQHKLKLINTNHIKDPNYSNHKKLLEKNKMSSKQIKSKMRRF